MPSKIELCNISDIATGAALRVERDDLILAVFNVGGEFFVTDDACTHGPGSLSEGYIEDDIVECNFHNGQFNIKTGEVGLAAMHGTGEDLSHLRRGRQGFH